MFDDYKVSQAHLLAGEMNEKPEARVISFAKMQDEYFFKWGVEIEELQEAIQYFISQGEADVADEMKSYQDQFKKQLRRDKHSSDSLCNDLGRAPSEEKIQIK